MKVLGITAEYNPFHNGHKYHLKKSVEMTGADCVVAVMSGCFTQRGELAVFDKWTRSRAAIDEGVDLVVELPFVYACSRGEIFAQGAVDILKELGVSYISFGSESGDVDSLEAFVSVMKNHSKDIENIKDVFMSKGNSFVKSMQLAVEAVLGEEKASLMNEPNNILAIEYLKRIMYWREQGKYIIPVTVKRYGSSYFGINKDVGFAGASVIRKMIYENNNKAFRYITGSTEALIKKQNEFTIDKKEENRRIFTLLQSEVVKSSPEELKRIYCMGEGLEYKMKKEIPMAESLEDFISAIVSRRYTEASIRRLIAYMLIGLKVRKPQQHIYARILAADEKGRKLIKNIKKSDESNVKIITNINKDISEQDPLWNTLRYDCISSDIYNIVKGRSLYRFSDKVVKPYIKIE